MAILLFAPPRAKAENVIVHGLNNAGNFAALGLSNNQKNYESGSNKGSVTNNVTATGSVALKVGHNEGTFVCSGIYGAGSVMVLNQNATISASGLVGMQGGSFNSTATGTDKFQILFEVPKGSSAIYHTTPVNTDVRDIFVPEGSKLRFRTLGGTIQSVKIELLNTIAAYGNLSDAMKWTSADADITTEAGSDGRNYVIITVKTPDCKDFTVDMSPAEKPFSLRQINGDWTPVTTLSKPAPIKYIWVNGEKKDIVDGKLEIEMTDRFIFKVPFTEGTSNVLMQRSATAATAAVPALKDQADILGCFNTAQLLYDATNSKSAFPTLVPEGTVRNNQQIVYDHTWQSTSLSLMPIYDSNAEVELTPTENQQIIFVLRPHNAAGFGDAVTVTVKRTDATLLRNLTPEIDADNLPEGCEWDPETKTYFYSKYDTDKRYTSKIRFKNIPFTRGMCY